MMRRAELRQPPVVVKAKGQLRAAVRYIRRVPELWIPMMMMAVVGTLTFNFPVVIPLFVEHTLHGSNGDVHAAVLGVEHRLVGGCAGRRAHAA